MINLKDYGYNSFFERQTAGETAAVPARVTAVHRERYEIISAHGHGFARLKKSAYFGEIPQPFPTTGDFVLLEHNPQGDSPILRTLERKTFFSRRDPTPGRGEQAVAANFDSVFLLASLNHDFNAARLERYLTLAWQSGGLPVIVLTKTDLCEDCSAQIRAAQRLSAAVEVVAVSAKTGDGLAQLAPYLGAGQSVVLLGSSGVGKSSLVNALAGEEVMAVNDIREDDSKGRHTTTHRQLLRLPDGTLVIDTPGMRELGMWDVGEGISRAFADVDEFLGLCRFSDCRHESEPGCAVKAAIEAGQLPLERWQRCQKLHGEARYTEDKANYMQSKRAWQKSIAEFTKSKKKVGDIKK